MENVLAREAICGVKCAQLQGKWRLSDVAESVWFARLYAHMGHVDLRQRRESLEKGGYR